MINNIQLSYPQYFLLFAVIIALAYALALYFKDSKFKDVKSWFPGLLSLLRFLSVLGILFLLLNPFIKQLKEDQKEPIIVIAEDRSESILSGFEEGKLSEYLSKMDGLIANLAAKYQVHHISFGDEVRNTVQDSFTHKTSNLSELLESIGDRFGDQNLGAVILSTDGIYNEGKNPLYTEVDVNVPIYSIALGDTTIKRDLYISNLLHNRIAYLGDKFSVQVDVQAFNAAGSNSKLKLYKVNGSNKELVKSENIRINNNNFFKTLSFEVDANSVGNVSYVAQLDGIGDESSTANNRKNFYMEILDARQRILIVAHAPHPDLGALKRIITGNKNYEVEIKFIRDEVPNLGDKDMVIFHSLPSNRYDIEVLVQQTKKKNIPILFIIGSNTSIPSFNKIQEALKISGENSSMNDAQGIFASNFNLYTIDETMKNRVSKFVPLKVPFGEFTTYPKAEVLLYQKIGTVDTKYPLALFLEESNRKVGIIAGEGLWRWNLFEYAQYEDQEANKEFVSKFVQFLSQKDDKRKFRVYSSQNNFKENEAIYFDAQLYNSNYEMINEADAFLTIKDTNGKKYDYTLSKSNNYYKLDAGRFPEGNYSYYATTNFNGIKHEASGKFRVESIQKEQYDLTARHSLLFDLSKKTRAKVFFPEQIASIESDLLNNQVLKPVLVNTTQTEKLLNLKWLALVIAFLLFFEWFFRRYFGHY